MSIETIQSSKKTISSLGVVSVINPLKSILETLLMQCCNVNDALDLLTNKLKTAGTVDNDLSAALESWVNAFRTKITSVGGSKGDNEGAGYLYQQCCQALYDISCRILDAQLCNYPEMYKTIQSGYASAIRQAVINIIRRHDSSCFVVMGVPVGPQADHARHLKKILDGIQFESKINQASLNTRVNISIAETKSIMDIVSEHRLPVLFFTPKETKGFHELTQAIETQRQHAEKDAKQAGPGSASPFC